MVRVGTFLALVLVHSLIVVPHVEAVAQVNSNASASPDFGKDVWPVLKRACLECHGPLKQAAELRVDSEESLLKSGAIDRQAPDQSELLKRIMLPRGHEQIMPARGEPLSAAQIEIIRKWLHTGATFSEQEIEARHWAYTAPKKPELPKVSDSSWIRTPIDAFILEQLDRQGLKPSPRAPSEKLVRRLFLDLIGLPPSDEEVQAFVQDPSDDRLAKLVDNLLQRPQFGERWARPWLDLARYADSHGFQRDNFRDMWAYRDWVIQALNADMPFDQFSIEQLAGDLLPNATDSQRIATGFHRCTPTNVEAGSLPEETRIEQVIDRVNTTGTVWLGTTLECCQCHDHKYDPFSQQDYYQLLAYFNSTKLEANLTNPQVPSSIDFQGLPLSLPNMERQSSSSSLQNELNAAKEKLQNQKRLLNARLPKWAAQTAIELKDASLSHTLSLTDFSSEGSTDTVERLADGSILLKGDDPPDADVYVVKCRVPAIEINALRIDILRHDSLPGKGPRRGDALRRNFVLNEFTAEVRAARAPAKDATPTESKATSKSNDSYDTNSSETSAALKFSAAKASFSQTNYKPEMAIDNVDRTGWAISPEFNQDHWITFVLDQPLQLREDQQLVLTMKQLFGQARTIGRFRVSAISGNVDVESVPDNVSSALRKSPADWTDADRELLLERCMSESKPIQTLQRMISKLSNDLKQLQPDTTEVMVELEAPRETRMFERGDYRKPGKLVSAGTPKALHALSEGPANRLTLARWLVSRENPLVARVTVNRWWSELFGQGIVTTPEDFGSKGEPPSHPALLDWLACELMDQGWSMKSILKTIVLSSTYQQSSNVNEQLRTVDPHNVWLARGPSVRMDAEMIRDNALAISGLLNLKQFGPAIRPYQPEGLWSKVGGTNYAYEVSQGGEQHRRGIYVILKRGTPYPSFINFDANARLACTTKRTRTNTAIQALTLLNDPVYVEAAAALAERVLANPRASTVDERIDYMFQLCTSRIPTQSEHRELRKLYELQERTAEDNSNTNTDADSNTKSKSTTNVKKNTKAHDDAKSVASVKSSSSHSGTWQSLATVMLNLHETITKD